MQRSRIIMFNKNSISGGNKNIMTGVLRALVFILFCSQVFATNPEAIRFHVDTFEIDGTVPVASSLIDATLAPYKDKEHSLDDLLAVAKSVEQTIRDEGYAFYRVVLPQQAFEKGSIRLKVVAFTLGEVVIEGNQFFDEANIRNAIPRLATDDSPNTEELAQDLKVAIHHPLKDMRLTFKQSEQPNKVDATVSVTDSKPTNFAVILANTGKKETGKERITGSFQHTNLWNKDHILNVSYTTSPGHFGDVKQKGGSYSMPLYLQRAWLTGYYVESDVDTGTVGTLDISGAGTMWGLHYLTNLRRIGSYEHWLDFGYDSRHFETDVGLFEAKVRSTPLSVLYKSEFLWQDLQVDAYTQLSINTGQGSDNENADYFANRITADRNWKHLRYGLTVNRPYKGWGLRGSLTGQLTNEALVSGEQFGLGGSTSIRGYEEREISKDEGYAIKLEAYSPQYKQVNFIGFVDYGRGRQEDVQPTDIEPRSKTLASFGAGMRWQYKKSVLVGIDLAHALKKGAVDDTNAGDNGIHGTIILNF
jgi:hemolysin activation/secretion protein